MLKIHFLYKRSTLSKKLVYILAQIFTISWQKKKKLKNGKNKAFNMEKFDVLAMYIVIE